MYSRDLGPLRVTVCLKCEPRVYTDVHVRSNFERGNMGFFEFLSMTQYEFRSFRIDSDACWVQSAVTEPNSINEETIASSVRNMGASFPSSVHANALPIAQRSKYEVVSQPPGAREATKKFRWAQP